jgi:hypothetical protein
VTVRVLPPHKIPAAAWQEGPVCDVTTHGSLYRPLSPMLLGPIMLYNGLWSRTVENAWQYSKVYPEHVQEDGFPGRAWLDWAQYGWDNPCGVRYPMGKGARPLYSAWAGTKLDYIAARRRIYIPLYAQAVRFYQLDLFIGLLRDTVARPDLIICDFDAYDHQALGYTWEDVITDPDRKMGHGFVLAMMIDGFL